ncbi:hypothetical protein JDV02_005830 [Purpureocillium takamizusanense]|uniref:Uncharacterized protein n=1 Tax=Purpureocillium takamizusanense TaxID=2060973 RepID=A0A9Q8VC57_9HYPO|nr:uncharacterized protein JDV02_005830 [Purpureocillium takamizusanense]UNI19656.1 hypothetical protein JDV02_005830 [Purpureocillium takamizusanense]
MLSVCVGERWQIRGQATQKTLTESITCTRRPAAFSADVSWHPRIPVLSPSTTCVRISVTRYHWGHHPQLLLLGEAADTTKPVQMPVAQKVITVQTLAGYSASRERLTGSGWPSDDDPMTITKNTPGR